LRRGWVALSTPPRKASPLTQYRVALKKLGLTQVEAAHLFGAGERSSRRWALDEANCGTQRSNTLDEFEYLLLRFIAISPPP